MTAAWLSRDHGRPHREEKKWGPTFELCQIFWQGSREILGIPKISNVYGPHFMSGL